MPPPGVCTKIRPPVAPGGMNVCAGATIAIVAQNRKIVQAAFQPLSLLAVPRFEAGAGAKANRLEICNVVIKILRHSLGGQRRLACERTVANLQISGVGWTALQCRKEILSARSYVPCLLPNTLPVCDHAHSPQ